MTHQTSPGVDRALAAAAEWAKRLESPQIRLVDYCLGLIHDEDGKPASLLKQLGYERQLKSDRLIELQHESPVVARGSLLDAARDWSIARRADPLLMTDALLLVLLEVLSRSWGTQQPTFLELSLGVSRLLAGEATPVAGPEEPPVSFDFPDELDLGAARAIDANLNRSREALRVLEDYFRFVCDDSFLTGEIKAARHDLAEAAKRLPSRLLIASRETLRDVGADATAGGEYERASPREVAFVNVKRLQESLRSLEEFGKLAGMELACSIEAVRYRAYTLERALILGEDSRARLADTRLYVLLTGSQSAVSLDWTIEQAAAGGATMFQLREKDLPDRELLVRARNVRRWTQQVNALFIVNDRPEIAKLVDADGVHLGQDDLSVMDARRILGSRSLIGVSTHSLEQVRQAVRDGADYLGIGPCFPSRTKSFESFPGLAFVREASAETALPMFALGGIGPDNIGSVVAAGARRVAVSSCVASAQDPEPVARVLRTALNG